MVTRDRRRGDSQTGLNLLGLNHSSITQVSEKLIHNIERHCFNTLEFTLLLFCCVIIILEILSSSALPLRVILPKSTLTQPHPVESSNTWKCKNCPRFFNTDRGRNQHMKKCIKANEVVDATSEKTVVNKPQETPIWGTHNSNDIELIINATYDEIVHWRKNIFLLPSGKAGKLFIRETSRLLDIWTNESTLSKIAFKAIMIMPAVLLQKPSFKSKAKEHSDCLKRRLELWENGQCDVLISE